MDTLRTNATHEVVNQASPLEGINFFEADLALREALVLEGGAWAVDRARDTGAVAGSATAPVSRARSTAQAPPSRTSASRSATSASKKLIPSSGEA